jgi:hypothetical protein
MNPDFERMLDASAAQRPSEFQSAFADAMLSKLHNVINNKKIELAQTMFNPQKSEVESEAEEE